MGACAGDYDNDGWIDLYVTSDGPNTAVPERGTRQLHRRDADRPAWLDSPEHQLRVRGRRQGRRSRSCSWPTTWISARAKPTAVTIGSAPTAAPTSTRASPTPSTATTANGTFTDVTRQAGVYTTAGKGLGVVFGDYDDDGWPDLFVANDLVPNFLYHNEGRGTFREVGLLAGVAVASDGKARAGMGTDFGDYDGDGRLDLVVTNFELETHNLFRNLGGGLFADATAETGLNVATLAVPRLRRRLPRLRQRRRPRPGDRQRPRARQRRALPRQLQPTRSATCCFATTAGGSGTSAAPPAQASLSRRSAGRWPPATSTTTATSICW